MDETFLTSKLSRAKKLRFLVKSFSFASFHTGRKIDIHVSVQFTSQNSHLQKKSNLQENICFLPPLTSRIHYYLPYFSSELFALIQKIYACMYVCLFFYMKHKFLIRNNLNSWLSKILKTKKIIPLVNGIYGIVKIN